MGFPIATNISSDDTRYNKDAFGSERPIYVRPSGDDDNDGSLVILAVRTLAKALSLIDYSDKWANTRQYIEMSGHTETLAFDTTAFGEAGMNFALPSTSRAAHNEARAGGFDNGKQDYLGYPIELYADPVLVTAVTIDSYTVDTETGLPVANVNVATPLTPGAHVGQTLNGSFAEFGVIHSNTATTITLASRFSTEIGSIGIYQQGCTLTMETLFGITLSHNGPVAYNGIKFLGGICRSLVSVYSFFQMCYFEGGFYTDGQGGIANAFGCYFEGGVMQLEGSAMELNSCVLQGVTIRSHGSGGNGRNTLSYSILDGCTPYGAGNLESSFDIEGENSWIVRGTSHGVQKMSPQRCRLSNMKIELCVNDAVNAEVGGGSLRMDTIAGGSNGGVGLRLANGAHAQLIGTNTTTGTEGDLKVGGSAVSAWIDTVPRTDAGATDPEFCRVY